jgi:CheY-like chemotaxis protein
VVDDDEVNRETMLELLRYAGIEADAVRNGRDAVEMVRDRDYTIVFMDIQMPEMDGLEATRQIRRLKKDGIDRLPILAVTAHAVSGDRETVLAAGMNDYLIKPIDPDALTAALCHWLPRDTQVSSSPEESLHSVTDGSGLGLPTPGLDVAAGLCKVAGNRERYLGLLADFASGYGDAPERLLEELRTDRLAEATHRVHAVHGIAARLGPSPWLPSWPGPWEGTWRCGTRLPGSRYR